MLEHHDLPDIDPLDRALDALRCQAVPEGPPPALVAATTEALQLQSLKIPPEESRLSPRRQFMLLMARYSVLAAAAVLLAILVGTLVLFHAGAGPGFAGVLDKIHKAQSVTCLQKQRIRDQATLTAKLYIKDDAIRMEIPRLITFIIDLKKGQAVRLDFNSKTASTLTDLPQEVGNPLEQLRQLKKNDAEKVGSEMLDGRKVEVYRLRSLDLFEVKVKIKETDKEDTKLWVDPRTQLPVKLVLTAPELYLEFYDFRWNEPLDPQLFSLTPPEGFTLKKVEGPPKETKPVAVKPVPTPTKEERLPDCAVPAFPFAQVLENVGKARSVTGKVRSGQDRSVAVVRDLYIQGDMIRREIPQFAVEIEDSKDNRGIQLLELSKRAFRWGPDKQASALDRRFPNPAVVFSTMKADQAQRVRASRFQGQVVAAYQIQKYELPSLLGGPELEADLFMFVAAETRLPVDIRLRCTLPGQKTLMAWYIWEKLEWNKPLDPALFQWNIPPGYQAIDGPPQLDIGEIFNAFPPGSQIKE